MATKVYNIKYDLSKVPQDMREQFGFNSYYQKYWDNMVMHAMEPYVPFLTGTLAKSAKLHSQIGYGEIVYRTPYARRRYYEPSKKYSENSETHDPKTSGPLRGPLWAERAKNDKYKEWVAALQKEIDEKKTAKKGAVFIIHYIPGINSDVPSH